MRLTLLIFMAVLATGLLGGCQTNAATGRFQFATLSREQEIALGQQAMPELIQEYGGTVQSATLANYVAGVGQDMAALTESHYPGLPWEFTTLDSEVINAFALPGGKVFISRGLLQELDSEAEIAGVLGHEIGHVTAEHVDERVTQAMGIEILGQLAGVVTESATADMVGAVVGYGGQGYLLKFGRDQESEADALGLRYMTRAGYSPDGLVGVLEVLLKASAGGGAPPEILSTHPHPRTRLRRVEALLDGPFAQEAADPNLKLYRERFQQYAAPYLAPPKLTSGGTPPAVAWCAHCRLAAAAHASAAPAPSAPGS